MYVSSLCSSADGHFGCFQLLAIVKNGAINMVVQIPLQDPTFNSLRYMPCFGLVDWKKKSSAK